MRNYVKFEIYNEFLKNIPKKKKKKKILVIKNFSSVKNLVNKRSVRIKDIVHKYC